MDTLAPAEAPAAPPLRDRDAIPDRFKWNLTHIFPDWEAWQRGVRRARRKIARVRGPAGHARQGPGSLLAALKLRTRSVSSSTRSGTSRRSGTTRISATTRSTRRRQQVQILFAKAAQACAWFEPGAADDSADHGPGSGWPNDADARRLSVRHRGSLPPAGARARRQGRAPAVAVEPLFVVAQRRLCGALDRRRQASDDPAVERHGGHADLRPVPRDPGDQPEPGAIARRRFVEFHKLFESNVNTYASLYNGVLQRDWFHAQARGYASTLDAALHGNNIPTTVVENLIATTKAGTEPLRRYHRLRKRVLGLDTYHTLRHDDSARRVRSEVSVRGCARVAAGVGGAARPRLPAADARGARRAVDRRLREPGQAERRLLGAGLRRAAVHAAELQRHARCGVHAGARDGPLDAHGAVARAPAVRLCGLHDLRRRSAVDAERGAVPRVHAGARRPTSASGSCCCSTPSTASSPRSTRR